MNMTKREGGCDMKGVSAEDTGKGPYGKDVSKDLQSGITQR